MSRKKQIEKKEETPQINERGNKTNGKRRGTSRNQRTGRDTTRTEITLFSTPTVNVEAEPIRTVVQVLELDYPLYDKDLTEASLAKVINAITVDRGYITSVTPTILRRVFEYSRNALVNFIHIKKLSNCQHVTDYTGRGVGNLFRNWSNDGRETIFNLLPEEPTSGGVVKVAYGSADWTAKFLARMSNIYVPEHYLRQLEFWYGSIFENQAFYGGNAYTHFRPSASTSTETAFEDGFTVAVNLLNELFLSHPDLHVILRQMGIPNVTSLEFDTRRDPLGQTIEIISGDFMEIQYAQGVMYPYLEKIDTIALPQNGDLIQGFSYEATFPVETLYSMVFSRNNVRDAGKYHVFYMKEEGTGADVMLALPPGEIEGSLLEAKGRLVARAFNYYAYAHNTRNSASIRYVAKTDKSGIQDMMIEINDAPNVFHLPAEWEHYVNILNTNNFFGVEYITYFEKLMNSIISVGTNRIIK